MRKDGEPIWVQLYVFAVTDDVSGERQTFGMNFDITEKMQAREALHDAYAELAHSTTVSRMGAMAASVAHEINQPLTAIVANAGAGLRFIARKPADKDGLMSRRNRGAGLRAPSNSGAARKLR